MNIARSCTLFLAILLLSAVPLIAQTYSGVNVCQGCHSSSFVGGIQYTQWVLTGHAKAYDSVAIIQNNSFCLPCHTTGWNASLANGGFDEFYPPADAQDSAAIQRLKNVQCESCHGPVQFGLNHGEPSTINPTAEQCGSCHEGTHHPYLSEWQTAAHSYSDTNASPFLPTLFRNDPNCSGCHTYQGFLEFVNDPNLEPNVQNPPGAAAEPLVCAACHDPHSNANEGQLRKPVAELCQKCHNPEYNPDTPTPTGEDIHHSTAYMLEGKGGYEYAGFTYESSAHPTFGEIAAKKCVTCHVMMTDFVSDLIPASTGHTFKPKGKKCFECHADFDTLATDFNYRGVQTEIQHLIDSLETKLLAASSADSATDEFKRAKFNFDFANSEGSRGIHNTKYSRGLLVSAIQNFSPSVGVEVIDGVIPRVFALDQNYPNPFNPATTFVVDLPEATNLRVDIYNIIGEKITTLMNGLHEAGRYEVVWNGTDQDGKTVVSGVYFYRLESPSFTMTRKMVLAK